MAARYIDDNEIRSQLDDVTMEDAYIFFKSVSKLKIRPMEEKIREKLPNSCKGNGMVAKKIPKFLSKRQKLLKMYLINFI